MGGDLSNFYVLFMLLTKLTVITAHSMYHLNNVSMIVDHVCVSKFVFFLSHSLSLCHWSCQFGVYQIGLFQNRHEIVNGAVLSLSPSPVRYITGLSWGGERERLWWWWRIDADDDDDDDDALLENDRDLSAHWLVHNSVHDAYITTWYKHSANCT